MRGCFTGAVEADTKKGADYLVCQIPGWEGLATLVNECFKRAKQVGEKTFACRDTRLGGLKGVILFADQHDNFVVVNNDAAPDGNWLFVRACRCV